MGQIDYKCQKVRNDSKDPNGDLEGPNDDKILIETGASLAAKKKPKKITKMQNPFLEPFDLKNLLEDENLDIKRQISIEKNHFLDFKNLQQQNSGENTYFNSDNEVLYDHMRKDKISKKDSIDLLHKDSLEQIQKMCSMDTENPQGFHFPAKVSKVKKLNSTERKPEKGREKEKIKRNDMDNIFSQNKARQNNTSKDNRKESFYSIKENANKDSVIYNDEMDCARNEKLINEFEKNRALDKIKTKEQNK